jgi:hypothetical protein
VLKGAAIATPGILLGGRVGAAAARTHPQAPVRGMNVLVFLTDQQRAVQHFPAGWGRPQPARPDTIAADGLTFDSAFTNACMCSPARSTLMSGFFPAQHGVKYTLETTMPAPQYPQVELATSFKNLASVTAYTRTVQRAARRALQRLLVVPPGVCDAAGLARPFPSRNGSRGRGLAPETPQSTRTRCAAGCEGSATLRANAEPSDDWSTLRRLACWLSARLVVKGCRRRLNTHPARRLNLHPWGRGAWWPGGGCAWP